MTAFVTVISVPFSFAEPDSGAHSPSFLYSHMDSPITAGSPAVTIRHLTVSISVG